MTITPEEARQDVERESSALFCAIPDTFKVEQLSDELLNLVSNKNK